MPGGMQQTSNAVPNTTPRLQDSTLQQGDVSMLQEGQRTLKQVQKPATPQPPQPNPTAYAAAEDADYTPPDPMEFAINRGGGTLNSLPEPDKGRDLSQWIPLLQRIATSPGSSGPLKTAYINMLRNVNVSKAQGVGAIIHMSDYDSAVERMLDAQEQ